MIVVYNRYCNDTSDIVCNRHYNHWFDIVDWSDNCLQLILQWSVWYCQKCKLQWLVWYCLQQKLQWLCLILQTGLTVFYNRHYNYWSDIAYDRNFSDWSDIVDGSDIVINKHCNYLQWTFQWRIWQYPLKKRKIIIKFFT